MTSILVSGAIANKLHNGGAIWTRLSWLLGFRQLGCSVFFVEEIAPSSCVDAMGTPASFAESANLRLFQNIVAEYGLEDTAFLLCGDEVWGGTPRRLTAIADDVDVLVNISGHCSRPDLLPRIRRKVYVDLDPGYTQIWHSSGNVGARLDGHDDFFTVGANIGRPGCTIPTCGVSWRPVRQPVLLTLWPLVRTDYPERFTTIASWRGPLGTVEHDGEVLGPKVREFRKFVTLPELVPFEFEIALDIHPAESNDIQLLQSHGWQLADPRAVAENPAAFRSYVQGSSAECSVSQGVYVSTRSGWFSDRTTRYLASGKPALVQDTGFSAHIPTGDGLIAFTTLEQAAEGARRIVRDYAHHCQAARDLAERYFDSDLVLGQFLDELGLCP